MEVMHNSSNPDIHAEAQHSAFMDLKYSNGLLTVKGIFENNLPYTVHLKYTLKCIRRASSGISASSQSGNFMADAGQRVQLSQTSFNVKPVDRYELILEILDNGKTLLKETLAFP